MEIIINGLKTNYQVFGEGKPFLILHGWGSNSDRWVAVAEKIAEGAPAGGSFKVIVPDLPGFGQSELPHVPWDVNNYVNWLDQLVKELNLKDFYLLGHSFGGALASKIAVKHAQDIKKLFLVSAACVRKKTAKKSFFKRISKVIKIFYFIPYFDLFRRAVYKFIINKSDYVYVQGIIRETYLKVISEDLSFHLPFIKIPTIIIWGDKDYITPLEDGYFIEKQVKKSKIIIISGAGHDLNRKQPEILAEKVLENC
ncbi:MAG: alpha/beta hydrolase [Candidatus Staskawiczbacteria bacterium]|nr:alpha/beta hydrolase [Candidatus Staskawiczbacteria bacterium]